MPESMPKNFDFAEAEQRIYERWEREGWFKPEVAGPDAEPFVISMPPPNITGALHIGHALFASLEDLMIRYERMRGKAALWVPGTDHASIATHLVVERLLEAEGTSRYDIGRDAFIERTWQWKREAVVPSRASFAASPPRVTGRASGSRWTRGYPMPSTMCSSACTNKG